MITLSMLVCNYLKPDVLHRMSKFRYKQWFKYMLQTMVQISYPTLLNFAKLHHNNRHSAVHGFYTLLPFLHT